MFPGSGTHSSNDTLAEITNTRWIKAGPRHSEHHHPAQHNKAMALKIHLLKFMTLLSRVVHMSRKLSFLFLADSHFIFLELQDIHLQLVLFFIQITFLSICLSYFPASSFHSAQRNLHTLFLFLLQFCSL